MDLRGNGGGHLTEATALSGLFVPGGPIVQLRETGGRVEVLDDPEPSRLGRPADCAGRSLQRFGIEIFAAAIQDYGRGLVVGQQTYGKGSVQNLYPLDRYALGPEPGFGQLTVTIGKYYRVTGESTQHREYSPISRCRLRSAPKKSVKARVKAPCLGSHSSGRLRPRIAAQRGSRNAGADA